MKDVIKGRDEEIQRQSHMEASVPIDLGCTAPPPPPAPPQHMDEFTHPEAPQILLNSLFQA